MNTTYAQNKFVFDDSYRFTDEEITNYKLHRLNTDKPLSNEDIINIMLSDEDYLTEQYKQFCLELTNELNNLNSESNIYKIDNSGFESKNIEFIDGEDLVNKLTPNIDWFMTVKVYENKICITIEHHENIHYEEYTVYKPE